MAVLQRLKLLIVWCCVTSLVMYLCKSFPSVLQRSGSRGLVLLDIRSSLNSMQIWSNARDSSRLLWNTTELDNFIPCEFSEALNETRPVIVRPLCLSEPQKEPPTVVMFTTAHDVTKRKTIHENIFKLWPLLGTNVKPVLFLSNVRRDRYLLDRACYRGWDVYLAPFCNGDRLPVLRSMFEAVFQKYSGVEFYGYANADILFDGGLVKTLKEVSKHTIDRLPNVLIIGRRRELKLPSNTTIDSIHNLIDLVKNKNVNQGFVVAVDFFITRSDFPWREVPPVVVGRRAYDNYLVARSNKMRHSTIDVSDTVAAIHLAGSEPYASSHKKIRSNYNAKLVGRFDFTHGLISCARWQTLKENRNRVALYKVTKMGFCGRGHWDKRKESWREFIADTDVEKVEIEQG